MVRLHQWPVVPIGKSKVEKAGAKIKPTCALKQLAQEEKELQEKAIL